MFDSFTSVTHCPYPGGGGQIFVIVSQVVNDRTLAKDILHERGIWVLFCFKHFNHKGLEIFYMHTN